VNRVERAIRTVDAWQQRHTVPGYVFGVIKKFGDDEASYLVALLTYFAFLATFPLLLAMSGILGLVLADNPALQHRITNSALSEFPIIGPQLHSQVGVSSLHHSGPALVIGLIVALLGGRGLANAAQHMLNTVWAVPKVDRPGFPWNSLRSLGLLVLLAIGVVATAAASAVAGAARDLGVDGLGWRVLFFALSTLVAVGLFWAAFRLGTAPSVRGRDLLVGAVLSGVAWQILLTVAGFVVKHDLRHAQSIAGTFGVVLGLLAWFALQATVTVYAIEADVVRIRRLWPRSIAAPPLTDPDMRALRAAAKLEIRRPEQRVWTRFIRRGDTESS
jgi:YihY family inner membrane protein